MPSTIHAAWMQSPELGSGSHLFVWAEDAEFTTRAARPPIVSRDQRQNSLETVPTPVSVAASNRPGKRNSLRRQRGENGRARTLKVPSHPEQVPIGALRALLNELAPGLGSEALQPANATVWLPTIDGAPALRRSLIGTVARDIQTSQTQNGAAVAPLLCAWQVTGVQLEPLRALLFLAHLSQETLRQQAVERPGLHRLRLGNDLIFWSNAAKFALELLVGQHYLPSLRAEASGRLSTVWQPFLLDPWIEERRSELTQTMPPVCRAYNLAEPSAAPAPVTLTEDFVATVVDAAVRAWGRREMYGPVQPESPEVTTELADVWLASLLGDQAALQLPPQPAHELYQSWSQWVEQLYIVRDANFRICFVLEEPADVDALAFSLPLTAEENGAEPAEAGDGILTGDQTTVDLTSPTSTNGPPAQPEAAQRGGSEWTLRYFLQARDNPSLMIGASEVWQAPKHVLQVGNRHIDQPQERLLAGLGVAGRLFPPIARSLRQSRPEHSVLTPEEAYAFLREVGPLLESSGFGVVMPAWWNSERRVRLGLRLAFFTDDDGFTAEDGEAWLDNFDVELREGGDSPRHGELDSTPNLTGEGPAGARLGLNSLVNYRWELTLGGEDLSAAEFENLTATRTPLLHLRGRWVELDPKQVEATTRFLSGRGAQGKTSLLQAIRVAQSLVDSSAPGADETTDTGVDSTLGARLPVLDPNLETFADEAALGQANGEQPGADLTVDAVAVHGWLEGVLTQLRTHQPPQSIAAPPGFKGQLRPYQERGVGWLDHLCSLGLGGCLADDMGLGKTIQAIALILHEQLRAESAGQKLAPTLLICPTSVVANWRREIERFAPGLRALVHHGNNRTAGDDFFAALAAHDMVVTSYGTARRDIEMLAQIEWHDLILDEAQNIKTPSAKQTQAVRRLQGRNRIALTGTPVENRLSELWSIMEFLNPGYLGKHETFRRRYIIPIERYNDAERTAELRRLVQPFLLRRLKSDPTIISDLPEKNEMVVYCSLTREQAQLYEKVVNEALNNLNRADGIQRRGLVLALLTRLKQITNHPAHYLKEEKPLDGRSGKLSRLTEMLDEAISVGDRALIFTQFVEMGYLLQRHLVDALGMETLFLHGGTPANQRDKMVQAFQSEDGPPVFVLSLRAGGSGLNLTQANHVFHYDRWWNPAVENQATDRAFRIGQRRDVQVHKFVVAGTLEERIHDLIENKQALAHSIVGSGEDWLTELETDELRELLMLRHDAIEDD